MPISSLLQQSSTTDIANQINQKTNQIRARMAVVQEWAADRQFPPSLRTRIFSYFDNNIKATMAADDAILSELSEDLSKCLRGTPSPTPYVIILFTPFPLPPRKRHCWTLKSFDYQKHPHSEKC